MIFDVIFLFNPLPIRIAPELRTVEDNPDTAFWNKIDEMDLSDLSERSYPYRVFGSGFRNGLNFVLSMVWDKAQQYCSRYAQGFRLSLHVSGELPHSFIHIPVEQEIYVSVKPTVIVTTNRLRGYPSARRGCFFQSERHLKFFQSYAQRNCELECLSNFTKDACKCVPFWMPSKKLFEEYCESDSS